jgi:uncharacterized protein (TIGR02001 family)
MKKSLILLPVLVAIAAGAQAQTAAAPAAAASAPEPAPSPVTANVNLTTNYKFRGQDQGNGRYVSPAIQGGFDWSKDGFYLGNWNSNVGFAGDIEMDFYGGYKGELAKDVGYDVGILQYYYPQKKDPAVNFNTTEIYGALSWQFLSFKYSWTVSNDYFGLGEIAKLNVPLASRPKGTNTGYFDLTANYPLMDKVTINAHLGYTLLSSDLRDIKDPAGANVGYPSYMDYKIGATYDLGSGFSAAAALIGANEGHFYGVINRGRVVVTLSKSM